MSTIDQSFTELLEDDTDLNESNYSISETRSGVIFLIDCTPTMYGLNNELNQSNSTESSGFNLGLLCCQTYQQNKALHNPNDMIGLVLMRTKESSSADLKNIYVVQQLEPSSASRILEIEKLRNVRPDKLIERFGTVVNSPDHDFAFHEVLWTCQNLFNRCSKQLGIKHIFLFTDDPNPVGKNINFKRRSIAKLIDMKQNGIELEVLPIENKQCKFDYDLFYNDLLFDENEELDIDNSQLHPDPTTRLDELLTRIHSHELRRRCLAHIPFHLGPDSNLTLGVYVYTFIRSTRIPTPEWISVKDNSPVTVQRNRYKVTDPNKNYDDVKDLLLPHDLVRGLKIGNRYICFDQDEIIGKMKTLAPVGLHLLGFEPLKYLKRHYYIRPAQFIYPDESRISGSRLWFTALLQRCLDRQVLALAIYVQRRGLSPRLVALVPQAENRNEDGSQLIPPGFHVIFLPFADDIRDINLPNCELANESQVDVAKEMIRKLMVPYDPKQIENPLLQRYYSILEALALNQESTTEIIDHTMPKIGAIKRRAGVEIENFRRCFNLPDENSLQEKSARSEKSDSEKKITDLTEAEIKDAIATGNLSKYTVPVLRQTAKSLQLKLTGSKKADIIEQIISHFKK